MEEEEVTVKTIHRMLRLLVENGFSDRGIMQLTHSGLGFLSALGEIRIMVEKKEEEKQYTF